MALAYPPKMRGATAGADGGVGLVPKPVAGEEDTVLHGDATWRATANASAATQAQAAAATSTTTFVPPAYAALAAQQGAGSRQVRDALFFDGATSNRRAEWALGTAGAVGALPVSIPFEFDVPTSNPSTVARAWYFTSNATAPDQAQALQFFIGTSGELSLRQFAATTGDYRILEYAGFRSAYSGTRVVGMVVFASPNTTTAPVIYINGIDVTASFSASTAGTPGNWVPSALAATYFLAGSNWPGRLEPHGPILGALTAAEVLTWSTTGRLPTWCDVGTGSAVAATSGTLTIGRKYRLKDWITADDFTNVGASSNADGVEFVATGTTPTTWSNSSQVLTLGPIFKPVIQPISVVADAGSNKIAGILTSGVTPICPGKTDFVIQDTTATNGNEQVLGAQCHATSGVRYDHIAVQPRTGTPTITIGNASGGTQIVASTGALTSAVFQDLTLVTRRNTTGNLWVGSNSTDVVDISVHGHTEG